MHATVVRPERAAALRDGLLQHGVGTADGRDAHHDDDVAVGVVVERVDGRADPVGGGVLGSSCTCPADHEARGRDGLGDEGRDGGRAGQDARCAARPGSGWCASTCATSSSWWVFSTRTTPDWRSISASVRGGACVGRTACPGGTT